MAGDGAAEYFGRALASARAERGFKRMQLKELSGLSYPYISEIENGGKYPSQRAIQALAAALDMTPSELLARAEEIEASSFGAGQTDATRAPYRVESVSLASPHRSETPKRETLEDEEVVSRLTEHVMRAVEPRLREWLLMEVRMAVAEELIGRREGR